MTIGASRNAGRMTYQKAGFVVATLAAVFMTVTEGLGTGVVTFWPRLLYWLLVMGTGVAIGSGVIWAVQLWGRLRNNWVVELLLIAVLIALPLTLAVLGAGMIILGMDRPSSGNILRNFLLVTFVSIALTAITYAVSHRTAEGPTRAKDDPAEPDADMKEPSIERFRVRLPISMRSAHILALASEDHYLRVFTDVGSTLVLMRLSDAIFEMDSSLGAQTHRGWWVARDAVTAVAKSDGKAKLTLSDGTVAPVSRSFINALREQDWL